MRVLLAVDGSNCSGVAAERLKTMFPGAWIDVVSVIRPPMVPIVVGGMVGSLPMATEMETQEALASAAIALAKTILGEGETVRYHVLSGDPGATIVHDAQERQVDLIVVGSHGYNLIERLLIGSVATYVVNHASCPVMVIPGPRHTSD